MLFAGMSRKWARLPLFAGQRPVAQQYLRPHCIPLTVIKGDRFSGNRSCWRDGRANRVRSELGADHLMLSFDQNLKIFAPCACDTCVAGFRAIANERLVELFRWR